MVKYIVYYLRRFKLRSVVYMYRKPKTRFTFPYKYTVKFIYFYFIFSPFSLCSNFIPFDFCCGTGNAVYFPNVLVVVFEFYIFFLAYYLTFNCTMYTLCVVQFIFLLEYLLAAFAWVIVVHSHTDLRYILSTRYSMPEIYV